MIDLSIAGELKTEFRGPVPCSNSEHMAELIIGSPYTIPGVSDGGAHMKYFMGGAYTTDFLQWLVRRHVLPRRQSTNVGFSSQIGAGSRPFLPQKHSPDASSFLSHGARREPL
jgi:hypothetical protein